MIGLCPSAYFEGFWHVRASLAVSVSAVRQRRCALAPYRPRVVVRRTAPRPTSTTHESLTVLCGCRLLLVAEGRVGALKECQNQEWPSDTFSEMPLPLVPSAHRSNHYDNELGTQGSNNPKITQNSVKWRFGPKISSPAARMEGAVPGLKKSEKP